MQVKTHTLEEFQKVAATFAKSLTPLPDRATVVWLYGDLGSGKTTFVQTVAYTLGVKDRVVSPTFVLMKRFKIEDLSLKFKNLIHIDAYRLKNGEDLRKLGFEALLRNPANLILVEWAEHVAELFPSNAQNLFFEFVNDGKRRIISYL